MWLYALSIVAWAATLVVLYFDFGDHDRRSAEAKAAAARVMNDIIDSTPAINRLPDPPTRSDVRRAYVALARKYHPDKCTDLADKDRYTEITQALNRVWEEWGDPDVSGDESDAEPPGDATWRVYLITIANTEAEGKLVPESRVVAADAVVQAYKRAYPKLKLEQWSVFQERHAGSGVDWKRQKHWHIVVKASSTHRWVRVKRELERAGYFAHFSDTHCGYHSAFRYGFVPTARKPRCELDPTPLFSDGHPDPFEASLPTRTEKASGERSRKSKAEPEHQT